MGAMFQSATRWWVERRCSAAMFGAAVLVPVLASFPATAGDPGTGLSIARRWCASCHVVEPGQKQAAADAPSFASIAKRRGKDPKLVDFLIDPHPKMPDMQINREEAGDIVAYIQSQAPQ